jgi:hypothetical protein
MGFLGSDEPLLLVTLATVRDLRGALDRHDAQQAEVDGRLKIARAHKIEELGPVASFLVGQGAVGDPSTPTLRPMIAVVTAEDFVFLASDYDEDVRVEYARVPRNDVAAVDVVDGEGHPVPEDVLRPVDPLADPDGTFVVALDRTGPDDDDHRMGFAVRSAVLAGEIRDRFRTHLLPA